MTELTFIVVLILVASIGFCTYVRARHRTLAAIANVVQVEIYQPCEYRPYLWLGDDQDLHVHFFDPMRLDGGRRGAFHAS